MKRAIIVLINLLSVSAFGASSLFAYVAFVLFTWMAAWGLARIASPVWRRVVLLSYLASGVLLWYFGAGSSSSTLRFVGVAFYVLVGTKYVLDLYRRRSLRSLGLLPLASVIGFFPSLLCGPVYSAVDLDEQLEQPLRIDVEGVAAGLLLIVMGLAKKSVADFSRFAARQSFLQPTFGMLMVDLIQFYLDFSGYSDIALGIGRVMGVHLPTNFRAPFLSRSPAEFWRRWHISVGDWIREQVFVPLLMLYPRAWRSVIGERLYSRLGIVVSMTLFGLWHQLSVGFGLWGLVNGIIIAIVPTSSALTDKLRSTSALNWLYGAGSWLATFYLLLLANTFRMSSDLQEAFMKISNVHDPEFIERVGKGAWLYWSYMFMFAALFSWAEIWLQKRDYKIERAWVWCVLVTLALFIAFVHLRPLKPFIYMSF